MRGGWKAEERKRRGLGIKGIFWGEGEGEKDRVVGGGGFYRARGIFIQGFLIGVGEHGVRFGGRGIGIEIVK